MTLTSHGPHHCPAGGAREAGPRVVMVGTWELAGRGPVPAPPVAAKSSGRDLTQCLSLTPD